MSGGENEMAVFMARLGSTGRPRTLLTALVVAAAIAVSLIAALSTGTARADPGFCGVRHAMYFGNGQEVYVVRNQCGSAHRFGVYLPSVQRYASPSCQTVGAYSEAAYYSVAVDPNWYIVNC
jgi:hypothetical protein